MQTQTIRNAHIPGKSPVIGFSAINQQLAELKLAGPEWDGPGSISPEPALIDRTGAWLTEHWRADLGIPDICPTADGGVSISWEWGAIEHSIDVRPDGASMEWCQYNPATLQTAETELPLDRHGWEAILAGLEQPAV